jgi:hypothetical protein
MLDDGRVIARIHEEFTDKSQKPGFPGFMLMATWLVAIAWFVLSRDTLGGIAAMIFWIGNTMVWGGLILARRRRVWIVRAVAEQPKLDDVIAH